MLEQQLTTQAGEIAAAGHAGWGNTMLDAAAELTALRKEAELLAWVLEHPETAAECLEDAAAGDGTARGNLEFRRDALAGRIGAA